MPLLLGLLLVLLGCDDGSSAAEQRAASTFEPAAARDPAVSQFRDTTIEIMCEDDGYERSCFDVTREGCRQLVAELYDACAEEHAAEIAVGTGAGTVGGLLGGCTSEGYIRRLRAEGKIDRSGRCAHPSSFF